VAYPDVAVDGQRLSDPQNVGAVAAFVTAYGNNAGQAWAQQHNAAIGFNSDPNATFRTAGGVKTATDLGVELKNAGYTGPWNIGAMLQGYATASGSMPTPVTTSQPPAPVQPPSPTSPAPVTPTTPTTPIVAGPNAPTTPISLSGDFGAWLKTNTAIFGVEVPNYAIAGAGAGLLALVALQQPGFSRRRNPYVRRERVRDSYGSGRPAVGSVRYSKTFRTMTAAEREAAAWRGTGDWAASSHEGRAPRSRRAS
jgi:hypothetical protein